MSVSTSSVSLVSDQLVAQIDLAEARLSAFRSRLDDLPDGSTRRRLDDRADGVQRRCASLRGTVRGTHPIPIGTPTAVEDLAATLDTLEADLEAATEVEPAAYLTAADRQARAWRSRTERLRVQAALGVMEWKDDLGSLVSRLDRGRGAVVVELHEAADDARDVVEDLRDDLEAVLGDVRRAVDRAIDAIGGAT